MVPELKPDFGRLSEVAARGIIVSRSADVCFDFVYCFFAPAAGVNEDPVTGSAHCALGPFWAENLAKNDFVAYQASARGGVVRVSVAGDRVLLGGQSRHDSARRTGMNPSGRILSVDGPEHLAWIRELFVEYARVLDFHICFEGFEKELGQLPGIYVPPEGRLFLALVGSRAAGCVAIKKSAENVCELKRLYVRPEFRGQHLGRKLVTAALTEAQAMGYRKVVLDTLPEMKAAQAIYRAAGFRDADAPSGDTLLMEMELL